MSKRIICFIIRNDTFGVSRERIIIIFEFSDKV